MQKMLLAALFLATLTLWIPAYWPVALFEIAVLLIAGIAALRGMRPPPGTRVPLYALSFIVAWGCFQLVTGLTTNRFATERATVHWMTWAALYYAATSLLQDQALARTMRSTMVWFGFLLSVEAILQAYLSPEKIYGLFPSGYHEFVMGPIVYHTHFAVLIETLLPIALYLDSYTISAVLLTSLVVSASRGGLVLALAEVLAVLILLPIARRRVLVLVGATAVLILTVGLETASQRFYGEALLSGRIQFAASTLHMIAARPWTGWGLGCWPAVYPAFATFDPGPIVNQAHTDWLQWTAEGGLPVGIAMLGLFAWAIRPALRSVWGIGVLAVLIHAAFDYPFSRPAVGAWPFLLLAMVANREQDLLRAHRRGLTTG